MLVNIVHSLSHGMTVPGGGVNIHIHESLSHSVNAQSVVVLLIQGLQGMHFALHLIQELLLLLGLLYVGGGALAARAREGVR